MAASIITTEDFETFKIYLFLEIKKIVESQTNARLIKWLRSIEVRKLLNLSNGPSKTFASMERYTILKWVA
jgi:hypothetical protein